MKKLTSLQVLVLMGFALSSNLYGKQSSVNTDALEKDAVRLILLSEQYDKAAMEVLDELAKKSEDTVERLILDEAELEPIISKVEEFLHKKLKEIQTLSDSINSANTEKLENLRELVAKLAIEIAHAQSDFVKAQSNLRMKHEQPSKKEQKTFDLLEKAKQAIIKLNEKSKSFLEQAGQNIVQGAQQVGDAVSKGIKNVRQHANRYIKNRSTSSRLNEEALIDSDDDSNNELVNDDQSVDQLVNSDNVMIQANSSGKAVGAKKIRNKR